MRLIDADALEKEIKEKDIMGGLNYRWYIQNAPTVDAVPMSVIEDIKAEIDKQAWAIAISDTDRANGMWDAYRIIDKYKGE